jgi:hypothetical protein
MAWMTLASFLITLPVIDFLIMLVYTYIQDSLAFAVVMRLSVFIVPSLIIYLGTWWYLVSGLICKDPSNMGTSWIPIIIFGIISFIATLLLMTYIWLFSATKSVLSNVQSALPLVGGKITNVQAVDSSKNTISSAASSVASTVSSAVSSAKKG